MKEPLDETVKKEIDQWGASGVKHYDWIEENLNRLNEIYCGKETIVFDSNTVITQPIQKMSLENRFLLLEGEGNRR